MNCPMASTHHEIALATRRQGIKENTTLGLPDSRPKRFFRGGLCPLVHFFSIRRRKGPRPIGSGAVV